MSDPSDDQGSEETAAESAASESAADQGDASDSEDTAAGQTEALSGEDVEAAGEAEDVEAASEVDDLEALRQQVEEKYDFDNFGPEQMDEMSAEEWEAAFDPDSWITGEQLMERVERDLKHEIAVRNVFARVERLADGKLIAYSDQGYATVHPDGSVEGVGTVLRDVKPIVALCSMEEYDVPEMPDGGALPEPTAVPEGSGELGNKMLQVIGAIQVVAGFALLGAWIVAGLNIIGLIAGLGFLVIGFLLFTVVANARLSDRFRAEEYRNRLRAVGVESGERPDFLPVEDDEWVGEPPTDRLEAGSQSGTSGDERVGEDGDSGEPETAS